MVNDIEREYGRWAASIGPRDLECMEGECSDPAWKADAFYRELAFGTGGLRGKIGMGPNRMNVYTVGKATQGLASYLLAHYPNPSVAVCRDSRKGGEEFVRRTAEVFAANGIRVLVFPRPEPTPALSFAVRYSGCSAGVNITASHNPAIYNGYKVYAADGCQITTEAARKIQAEIDTVDALGAVPRTDFDAAVALGLVRFMDEDVLDGYVDATLSQSTGTPLDGLRVAYTPLNGTGLECVSRVLGIRGTGAFDVVEEQKDPDGNFPTCPYPNPEIPGALALGMELCASAGSDLLVATDPDADRLGVAVPTGGGCVPLSGNELGLLMLEFLARRADREGRDLSRMVAMTTIVSAPMADDVARAHGFELRRTLTGFKFIGEQIGLLAGSGRGGDFLFGFEESCGYLSGAHVRDKDGVVATMLACELAAYWKSRGMNLLEAMGRMYCRYGYWADRQVSIAYDGPEGAESMGRIMDAARGSVPAALAAQGVVEKIDYSSGAVMPTINPCEGTAEQHLPSADVLEFRLADGSRVLVRPSGTEPKIKAYIFARAEDQGRADARAESLERDVRKMLADR